MENDERLLVAVFKEIAVLQGKRKADGNWIDAKPWDVQNALEVAIRVIAAAKEKAANPVVEVKPPFTTTRKR